jgi:hypothetical protein
MTVRWVYVTSPSTFPSHEDRRRQLVIFTSFLPMPAMDLARAIAQLQRQRCRVTSHPVASFGGCTTIPHARGRLGGARPNLSAAYFSQPKSRFTPPDPRGWPSLAELRSCCLGSLQGCPFGNFAMCREAPERNEELAGKCDDRDASKTTAVSPDALLEPPAQCRSWLMSKP